MKKYKKIVFTAIIFFAICGLISALLLTKAAMSTKSIVTSLRTQELEVTKKSIQTAKGDFGRAHAVLMTLTPLRIVPVLGWYVADAQRATSAATSGLDAAEILVEAIMPYADVLGLKGQGSFLGGTAQERISSVVATLSKVSPQLEEVGKDLETTEDQLNKIQSWRYPNILPGRPGEKIDAAKTGVTQIETLIVDAKPFIEVLPEILGQEKEKTYLVLLQNDKELRPTGGFITAYAVLKVNKGNITSELSEDIYKLDDTLTKKIAAPEHIRTYLEVQSLNIRDSNISPDYLSSIRLFEDLYAHTTSKVSYDGIISLDTNFVLKMLEALGPIEVDGTKYTSEQVDECDCPQIIYELEKYTGQPTPFERENRKGIIGVLMQAMMTKTFEAPKAAWPNILSAVVTSLQEKNMLLYFEDAKTQEAIEKVNFAGRIYQYDGDFLHINESNLGGAKSNLYIQEKVKQEIKKEKDKIVKKVTVEYKYPRRGDNCSLERQAGLCLAGIYRDWIRFYVPEGSTVISSTGSETPVKTYDELGKTVFQGFITVKPEGVAKLEIEYTLPIKSSRDYKLLIQKQPGTPANDYEINAFGKKVNFPLTKDKEFITKI